MGKNEVEINKCENCGKPLINESDVLPNLCLKCAKEEQELCYCGQYPENCECETGE